MGRTGVTEKQGRYVIEVDVLGEPFTIIYKCFDIGILFNAEGKILDEERVLKEVDSHWHKLKGYSLPAGAKITKVRRTEDFK